MGAIESATINDYIALDTLCPVEALVYSAHADMRNGLCARTA